jgi:organic hydroperoxide reductase OsmC/OhrA
MAHIHRYALSVEWTGNLGTGTDHYRSYTRDHVVRIAGKPDVLGSSDPAFRGDPLRHNPEDLLLAALSACHMMSYLHMCAVNGVVVIRYTDNATATIETSANGSGHFAEAVLHPIVVVRDPLMLTKAEKLHHQAHELCFIANSVNFPVRHDPTCMSETQ